MFSFSFSVQGVTIVNFAFQTTPEEESQGLRSVERVDQLSILIILTPKTSDKDVQSGQ
jgi:hypothetical protein